MRANLESLAGITSAPQGGPDPFQTTKPPPPNPTGRTYNLNLQQQRKNKTGDLALGDTGDLALGA